MNALEIVGLACVDRPFRRQLFENVDAVILANRTDLTWAEEEGLRRITKPHRPKRMAMAMKSAEAAGEGDAEGSDGSNDLPDAMEKVGEAIEMMCPVVPCAWPDSFTQNRAK